MKLRSPFLLIFPFLIVLSLISAQITDQASLSTQLKPGVVVERVTKDSAGEKAGIQPEDIFLTWVRADAKGRIDSSFDLSQVEIEQAPRGNVTLEGMRGTEAHSWRIGPDAWGMEARPNLEGKLLDLYKEGQALAAGGKFQQAADRWRATAAEAQNTQIGPLGPWFLLHAAETLSSQKQFEDADDAFRRAVELAETTNPRVRAQLFSAWGDNARKGGDWDTAETHYQQAAAESRSSDGESLMLALNLRSIGSIALRRGDLAKAAEYLGQALAMRQRLAPGSLAVAGSLQDFGDVLDQRGDLARAEDCYQQASEILQKLVPESLRVAVTFNNLGDLARDRGNFVEAEEYHRHALKIREEIAPASLDVAASLTNLGIVALNRGDLAQADAYLNQALEIENKLAPGSPYIGETINNLGIVAMERGDLAQAAGYLGQALQLGRKLVPGSLILTLPLINLGLVAERQRDFKKAEEYLNEALAIRQKLAPGSLALAQLFISLGELARDQKDGVRAGQYFNQALNLTEKISPDGIDSAFSLQDLAELAREGHQRAKAEAYFRRALAIWEKLAPESQEHAASLAALASILREEGQPDGAAHLFEQALNVLETQTSRLGGSQDTRSEFRAKHSDYFKDYIDLLNQQNRADEAFQVAERGRARLLLEMLAAGQVDVHRGADPKLLETERSLQASLNAKRDRRVMLLTSKHQPEQVKEVEKEIEAVRAEYDEVESKLRATSPSYAALTQPLPLTSKEAQQLLDDDALLLEYSLGAERSYLWALTSSSLTIRTLPGRQVIEARARQLHKQISALSSSGEPNSHTDQRWQHGLDVTASVLSRMILQPVAHQLQNKRLLIVADGALQYVPFAFLPEPGRTASAPLILRHEIVYSPSASVLAELRRNAHGRVPAAKAVAVLADPVFDRTDPRVNSREKATQAALGDTDSAAQSAQHLHRSAADVGLAHLPRLAFSRREADAIIASLPGEQGLEAVGFEASRATATSHNLAEYRTIHFATHALSDNRHPELSGLVFSLVDAKGRSQNGFLDLQDIYNLNLPVDLVVLSACETALGKEVQGEGIVGLTRGFMYAGATRVIASLWHADDEATKDLMEKFYRNFEQERMSPAAALRSAQVAMWKQQRWRNPYYWAAFQLHGEWK